MNLRTLLVAATALFSPLAANAAGALTIAQSQDPATWDPVSTFLISWGQMATNVFDGLVQRGADMQIKPALATSWQLLDDNKRIRFKLRDGVTFQDGEKFDADAVKFTMERLLGPLGAKGPQQSNYTSIGSVEVVDPMTVDLVLKQPDPVLLTKLAGYGGVIVPPEYIKKVGDAEFAIHPIGTGAFKVTDYQTKVSATLEPFPTGWRGPAKLDRVVYRFIVEPDTQVAELQAGRVDIATNVPIALVPIIQKSANLRIDSVTGPTVTVLRFNTDHGATANEAVRHAMIMAVDRDTIISAILQGQAKPVTSFQSALSYGNDPDLKPVPFDPTQARALLKQAGVAPGTPVQLDFRGNDTTFREVAQAVAGYLTAVGLKPTVKPYEMNIFTNDIIPNGKTGDMWQFGWGGWTFDYDNTAYLMYHSGQHWNPYLKDATLDAMLEEQRPMMDSALRLKKLQAIADYVAGHAIELPMYNLNTIYGVNKRVTFTPALDNRLLLTDAAVQ